MQKIFFTLIIIFVFALSSCSSVLGGVSEREQEISADGLIYETVYFEGDFRVREAYFGTWEEQDWDNFAMPVARVEDSVPDVGLGHQFDACYEQFDTQNWCTVTGRITTSVRIDTFDLTWSFVDGGDSSLYRNGRLIWEGHMNGGTCNSINSTKQIGDEIAIAYVDIDARIYDHEGNPIGQIESILLTDNESVIDIVEETDYHGAFAPNEIQEKLTYFAHININSPDHKILLIFDGKEVSEYDWVFNQCCCWGGPDIQVASNGKLVDFFAEKDDGWYHVQAGELDSLN